LRDQFVLDIFKLTIHETRTSITVNIKEDRLEAVLQKKVSNTARISIDSWLFTSLPHGHSVEHHLCAIDVTSGPALVSAAGAVNANLGGRDAVAAVPFGLGAAGHGQLPSLHAPFRGFTWTAVICSSRRMVVLSSGR